MTSPMQAVDQVQVVRAMTTGRRDVMSLAHRPGSPVVHLYSGPLSPSGRFAAAGGRTVCRARTRRLTVLERDLGLLDHGRRVCGRCTARLSSLMGRAVQPVSRDQHLTMFRGMTLRDLALALSIAVTVDDTYRIGFIASLLFGAPPIRRPAEFTARQAYCDLHAAIIATRRRLIASARTPEQIEQAAADREAQVHNLRLTEAARRKAARLDKLADRAVRGQYLTGRERVDLGLTG